VEVAMKILPVLPVAILLLLLGSCKKEAAMREEAPDVSSAAAPEPSREATDASQSKAAPAATPSDTRAPALARKLIRTVNLQLEVKDTEDAAAQVQALATRLGGFVGSSNGQRRGELMYYSLTLRVPAERLDEALAAIRALAIRVDQEQQQVDDVTDQYIDLDARMRTLEATETELRALLAESRQRARKVEEIMAVYQQLIEVRSQIEQIRTQLNSFDKLAALSTINLELVPTEAAKPVAGDAWRPGDTLRSSARTLVGFLRWLLEAAIFFVVVLLPIGLVIAAVVMALRWFWRRARGRPHAEPPPGDGPAVR